jgi:hypothetical protein
MALDFQPTKPKTEYEVPQAGGTIGRVYRIVDLGTQQTSYMGEIKMTPQVMLVFELPTELTKDGRPMTINGIYTRSLNEKAKLRAVVRALTGKTITDSNVREFNLSELIGKVCTVDIINKDDKMGNRKAYIQNIASAPKGIPIPDMFNESLIFDLSNFQIDSFSKLPKYWQDRISLTKEYALVNPESVVEQNKDNIPF